MLTNVTTFGPVVRVSNLVEAVRFFETIGFKTNFMWGEPAFYAVMVLEHNGDYGLHLHQKEEVSPDGVGLYFITDQVDAIYDNALVVGLTITDPIADQPYGMRDFTLEGPDRIPVSIGKEIH